MKVTFNWLKQFVDFNGSPGDLAARLTMLGLEVEGVRRIGGEFDGIVVAQVITRDKHPNADKLSLCRVNDGGGERQIVCGAHNFKAGDKVPLILPGASLPLKPGDKEPFTIKVGKIRGVESHGMLCSPQELGLPDSADGLLILREDATVGQPFAEYLGRAGSDVIYDLEVTPNRPDLNSVIGIAREIAAQSGLPLRIPEVSVVSGPLSTAGADPGSLVDKWIAVRVEEPDLCPRYTARVVKGVKIGPSPDWLRGTLEKVGVRSINNVVDVTNYVMLEIGQPLHAFDYRLLGKSPATGAAEGRSVIVVRRAREGEKFTTLDGVERTLTDEMLLVTDGTRGIALAGVMGGEDSEITSATREVLVESACFKPQNIRRTSKRLGLRSESSYRFERGADIGIAEWASRRCAKLILETAGGELVPGAVDAFKENVVPREITLRHAQTNALLGIEVPVDQQIEFLSRLGLEAMKGSELVPMGGVGGPQSTFRIPTWRVDLKREADLIEDVARLYGVDRIPSRPPRAATGSKVFDALYDQLAEVRRNLTGLGLDEAQGQTLISDVAARLASGADTLVWLANPLSSDMNVLRPSLLPGLLEALRYNVSRKNHDLALFEIGRVFVQSEGRTKEERRLAIALTGQRSPGFWSGDDRDARFDVFDLKGVLEGCLEDIGVRGVAFVRRPESTPLFLESATLALGGKLQLGEAGQLLPSLAKRHDLRDAVFLAELNLDQLLARQNATKSFRPLPQLPAIRRDVAMVVSEDVTHDAVLNVVRQSRPANLEMVELFDVFRGKNVPEGRKSVAYAFTYRHAERTLTDEEVGAAHDKLVGMFEQGLKATIR